MMRNVRSTTRTVLWGVALLLLAPAASWGRPISLEGNWRFEMDPSDSGERQQWFNRNLRYLKFISLSGFGPDKTTALAELAVMYAGPKLSDGNSTIEP